MMSSLETSAASAVPSVVPVARYQRAEVVSTPIETARQAEAQTKLSPVETKAAIAAAQGEPVSLERLNAVVAFISETVGQRSIATEISVDEDLGRVVIQINDKETGELVRQIPGEAFLEIAKRMEDLKGLLYDDKA
jgi:flagellar protein FlaG